MHRNAATFVFVTTSLAAVASAAPPARGPRPPAAAPSPAPPSEEPRSLSDLLGGEAKTSYDIARILYRDGDHAGALAKFRRSYESSHDARLLWNMAACEKNLRHYVKVLDLVDKYVKEGQLDAPDLQRALTFATAVRTLVGEVEVRTEESGATVNVDDEPFGDTPFAKPILLDMGRRRVRVTKSGFRPFERTLDVEGGARQELAIVLEREAGRVSVRARPGDAIRVDDKVMGQGSWSGSLPAGPHVVVATSSSGRKKRSDVVLADREARELTLETEGDGVPKWIFWVGGGVLVAGATLGGYFLFRPGREEPPAGTIGAYQVPK